MTVSQFAPFINGSYEGKNILSMSQFDVQSITILFDRATECRLAFSGSRQLGSLSGSRIRLYFDEQSTRTATSFEVAAKQLGAITTQYPGPDRAKEEDSVGDSMITQAAYHNLIVMRSKEAGLIEQATEAIARSGFTCPVINAGNGDVEHPTQALLDLFTIMRHYGRVGDRRIAVVGDLKHGRTIHSLLKGLNLFPEVTVVEIPVSGLELPESCRAELSQLRFEPATDVREALESCDVWSWSRTQRNRSNEDWSRVGQDIVLNTQLFSESGGEGKLIMHPFPRKGEIDPEVDRLAEAAYFREQLPNGVAIRMALLALVIGR